MFLTTTPPAENSRSIATGVLDQRDEADGHDRLGAAVAAVAGEAFVGSAAHGADEVAVVGELLEQRRRWLALGRRGHGDAVEGSAVGGAATAVAGAHLHVVVAELAEHSPRAL